MNLVSKIWLGLSLIFVAGIFFETVNFVQAKNIVSFQDLISNSAPGENSNHTLSFTVTETVLPSSYIDITLPVDMELLSTSTFARERNVEVYVDGDLRPASTTLDAGVDKVETVSGLAGSIRYVLNSTEGIAADSEVVIKIGNHTSKANHFLEYYDTDLATTTRIEADTKPIRNSGVPGTKKINLNIYKSDNTLIANAGFVIATIEAVSFKADTTDSLPPFRFDGTPTGTIVGVSVFAEMALQTDEFATCRYSNVPDTPFELMTGIFSNTGKIFHSENIPLTPNSLNVFYIRCSDNQNGFRPNNVNLDDFLIEFSVTSKPAGETNTEGENGGDGSGTGNSGSGTGSASGGGAGSGEGEAGGSSGSGSGGGGGGGGGGGSGGGSGGGFENTDGPYRSGDGRVIISGQAFPNAEVVILADGKEVGKVRTNATGGYEIVLDKIARGTYTFGVYGIDPTGVKTSTFSTSFTVSGARATALSNINISPSIKVTPDPVNPGGTVKISGFALPEMEILIENIKEKSTEGEKSLKTVSLKNGAWSVDLETTGFSIGTYKVRARALPSQTNSGTSFSNYTLYGVGQAANKPRPADLNRDGKVNLTDFSILLFWWNTNGGTSDPSADISGDGKVNLTDFSILLFNWTG